MSRYKAQVREVINRNALVSVALAKGYNAFLPVYDGGVDFILYNEETGDVKKVQLKGRWNIDKKYIDRDIWIAFYDRDHWYLVPHDTLVEHGTTYGYTDSPSWKDGSAYSVKALTRQMLQDLQEYRFEPLGTVSEKAAEQ